MLLRAARSRTRFAALISVHGEELRGRKALGDGVIAVDTARIEALRIPRNAVPVFEAAITSRAPSVGPLATGEPFLDGLLEQIGGPSPISLVLPVAVGARTVALRGGASRPRRRVQRGGRRGSVPADRRGQPCPRPRARRPTRRPRRRAPRATPRSRSCIPPRRSGVRPSPTCAAPRSGRRSPTGSASSSGRARSAATPARTSSWSSCSSSVHRGRAARPAG